MNRAELPIVRGKLDSGQPVTVACLGDSITGVYYHTGGRRAWADAVGYALRDRYPRVTITMLNAGLSGDTTRGALVRMERDVLARNPDLVVIMLGLNDVVHFPPADYRANLRTLIERSREAGADVILMTPNAVGPNDPARPIPKVAAHAEIAREVARELRVPLADAHRAYESVRVGDPAGWMRLMSDAAHPNMRGHQMFAQVVVEVICGRSVALPPLPTWPEGLPRLAAKVRARQSVRIVAMTPFDTLVPAALRRVMPGVPLEVTPWTTTGKTIIDLESDAMQIGWTMYRANPDLPEPDLFVVSPPCDPSGIGAETFYRSWAMILNRCQSFGEPRWDCLAILPSVTNPALDHAQRDRESLAHAGVLDKDLPVIQRRADDPASAEDLLTSRLTNLLPPADR